MTRKERKLQVFVSSTFRDLVPERQAAVSAILKAGHIPAGMELFTAGDLSQMDTIKEWIDESDVYVLLLGGRYGSVEPVTGLSYTELEYDYASSNNKPVFSIVQTYESLESKIKIHGSDILEKDHQNELKQFRDKVLSKISSFFSDDKDIKLAIYESLQDIEKDARVVGWVRADSVPDQAAINAELANLRKENTEVRAELARIRSAKEASSKSAANDWREIARTLMDIEIKIPATLTNGRGDVTDNLFNFTMNNKDTLINGVYNSYGVDDATQFFYYNVMPKLLLHGLADNERVPGKQYRRSFLNKAGQAVFAAYEREAISLARKKTEASSPTDSNAPPRSVNIAGDTPAPAKAARGRKPRQK